jgi:hypothetical protein
MNKIILSVGSDDKYLTNPHLINYLKSIFLNSNFDYNIISYLGEKNIESEYNKISVAKILPSIVKKINKNNCIQHGEFLNSPYFKDFSDQDIICFTDGDMTIQRPLSEDEINFIRNLKDNDVFVGYNKSPEDTLYDEYYRISPKKQDNEIGFEVDLKNTKVYNTGVLIMNKKTWLLLMNYYIENFDTIDKLFEHYAKQQWLICYLFKLYNFNVIEMGYNMHNHTHYPSPLGTTNENGIIKYYGDVVLFKHRWF